MALEIESYDLQLDIDFYKASVKGKVGIRIKGAPKPLALDSSQLKIGSVSVDGKTAKFDLDEKHSKLKVYGVPARSSLVEIDYTKVVQDNTIFGLYKSKYGKDYVLATDLEPAEARTVFPCVDDPAHKAVFRLEIITDPDLTVISNTPVEVKKPTGDRRNRFVFQQTPRMSTYLFFFAIGKFEERSMPSGNVEVITATRPGQSENSELVLKIVAEALADYQSYYDVPYPLKKLHVVALPEYHTGAMENWGAISSREGYALVTETTSFGQKNRGALSMVHEVAHQWFGDLVTMKWWDDLWLNESFATFMSYKMTDRIRPEWGMWSEFIRDETFRALEQDALSTTHPVQAHITRVEDAMHIFDAISYNKGASVLRMLEAYVGEQAFRKGVSDYLRRFSYSNASGKDLWDSLGKASKLPVTRVAREWLTKPGYPVIEVSTSPGKVSLSQRPFRLVGKAPKGVWPVPISIRADGKETSFLLEGKSTTVKATTKKELLVNIGHTGFFTVLYDKPGYERLAANFARLTPPDRAGLMNDLYLFLQAGVVEPDVYFRFLALCGQTPDTITVETASDQLVTLTAIAGDSPALKAVYPKFFPALLGKIGVDRRQGEPEYVGAARETLASQWASIDQGFARKMASRFDQFETLDPNLKEAVAVGYAVTHGARAKERLLSMVKTNQNEVDRAKLYTGLCAFEDPKLIEDTLNLGISGEVSRSDSAYPIIYSAYNPHARDVLWRWITKNYEGMKGLYAGSQQFFLYMGYVLPVCGVTEEAKVKRFFSGKRLKEGGSTYSRAMEHLGINSKLRKRLLGLKTSSRN